MKNNDKWRMYFLVPYNISSIQSGIQAGHAAIEYSLDFFYDIEYQQWAKDNKTFIILNGGTSNNGDEWDLGSMEQHEQALIDAGVKFAKFHEPDLNFMLSAIVFLVPEQVYKKINKEDGMYYPDFDLWLANSLSVPVSTMKILERNEGKPLEEIKPDEYAKWVKFMGGEQNVFLRKFTAQFRLASN